jgi:WD40 repeat protein
MPRIALGWFARRPTAPHPSALDAPATSRRSKAFISYRRGRPGGPWANWLQSRLERFPIPKPYRKAGEARIHPVFLDVNDAAASGEVQAMLNEALDASDHLVVVCDDATPSSTYVLAEIRRFLERQQQGPQPAATLALDRVSALLVEGEVDPTFASLGSGSPAGGDVRRLVGHPWGSGTGIRSSQEACTPKCRRHSCRLRRRAALVRIAAAIIGCDYDDLVKRERRRRRKTFAAATFAALLMVIGGWQYIGLRHYLPSLAASTMARLSGRHLPIDGVAPLLDEIAWLQTRQAGWRWFLLPADAVYRSVPQTHSLARMLLIRRVPDVEIAGRLEHEVSAIGSANGREILLLTTKELVYLSAPSADEPLEVAFRTTIREPLGWNGTLTSTEHRAVVVGTGAGGRIVATTYDFRDPARPDIREYDTPQGTFARAAVGSASLSEVVLHGGGGMQWWTLGSTAVPLPVPADLSETATIRFCPGSDRAVIVDGHQIYVSRTAAPGSAARRTVELLAAGLRPVCLSDGRRLAMMSPMKGPASQIHIYDLDAGALVGRATSSHTVSRLAVAGDDSQLVAMSPNGLSVWSQRTFTDPAIPWGEDTFVPLDQASQLAFVGAQLAVAVTPEAGSSAVRLIDLATAQVSPAFSGLGEAIVDILGGERVTVVSWSSTNGGTIRLSTLTPKRRSGSGWYRQTRAPVSAAALSEGDTVLYARSEAGLSSCSGPASCDVLHLLADHKITGLDVSVDGRWAAALSASGASARLTLMSRQSNEWVEHASVAVPPDVPYAVATNGLLAWQSTADRLNVRHPAGSFVECPADGGATAMTFGSDARTLAVAMSDRTIRVGRVTASCPEWARQVALPAQAAAVSRLRYSPDGQALFAIDEGGETGRKDSRVWIIDLRACIWPVRGRIDWPDVVDVRSDTDPTRLRVLAATEGGALVLDSSDGKF